MKKREKVIGSIVLICILSIFLIIGYINTRPEKISEADIESMFVQVEQDKTQGHKDVDSKKNLITVEIKGEVNKPDVYIVEDSNRLYQLIELAGGTTENADLASINRASTLTDGQCIIIGNINNKAEEHDSRVNNIISGGGSISSGKININSASKDELMLLTGVGESKANAIISYREKVGNFKKVEDLQNVDGIGEKTVEKLKDSITVN